jgi:small subunit ribosomal protein S16
MAVKIRLQRGGAKHAPYYRVVVADIRSPRDGRFVEKVGIYDPKNKDEGKQLNLELERIDHWIGMGAKPSDTVRSLIKKARRSAPAEAATE